MHHHVLLYDFSPAKILDMLRLSSMSTLNLQNLFWETYRYIFIFAICLRWDCVSTWNPSSLETMSDLLISWLLVMEWARAWTVMTLSQDIPVSIPDGLTFKLSYCIDVIMGTMASQITSLTIVYPTVYAGADQRKHESSASLAIVQGIYRWPVNSPHKWPVTSKMFPFDDVIMSLSYMSART